MKNVLGYFCTLLKHWGVKIKLLNIVGHPKLKKKRVTKLKSQNEMTNLLVGTWKHMVHHWLSLVNERVLKKKVKRSKNCKNQILTYIRFLFLFPVKSYFWQTIFKEVRIECLNNSQSNGRTGQSSIFVIRDFLPRPRKLIYFALPSLGVHGPIRRAV